MGKLDQLFLPKQSLPVLHVLSLPGPIILCVALFYLFTFRKLVKNWCRYCKAMLSCALTETMKF